MIKSSKLYILPQPIIMMKEIRMKLEDDLVDAKKKSGLTYKALLVLGLKYLEEKKMYTNAIKDQNEEINKLSKKVAFLQGTVSGLIK